MLLKKIKYHDFRQFIGDQEIDLSIDSDNDKNIVVILGDNTHGKSTIILSFIWCLYGISKFDNRDSILNKSVERCMEINESKEASVEIIFENGGIKYEIKRTQRFTKNASGDLKAAPTYVNMGRYAKDGQFQTISSVSVNSIIKSILPEDLSSYFFFQGEKNNNIDQKDLKEAVKTLIGLNVYDNMIRHLHGDTKTVSTKSVLGYYATKQRDYSSAEAQQKYDKIQTLSREINEIDKNIAEIEAQIPQYDIWIKQEEDILRENKATSDLQKTFDKLEKDKASYENFLKNTQNEFIKLFGDKSFNLFITPFIDKTKEKLKNLDLDDRGVSDLTSKTINSLLKRRKCLCGTQLVEGSLRYNSVKSFLDIVPPNNIGTIVKNMSEELDEYKVRGEDFKKEIESKYADILQWNDMINNTAKDISSVSKELAEKDNFDEISHTERLNTYKDTKFNLSVNKVKYESEKQSKIKEIDNLQSEYDILKSKEDKAKKYDIYHEYAYALYEMAKENYKNKENDMRINLSNYVTDMFNAIYSGEREVVIDDKYNVILNVDGENVSESGGLQVIKYFSFVGALTKLAKDVMQKDKDEKLGEIYPLVLDAAFSHTDGGHTKKIAQELSKSVNQLVLAVMRNDWRQASEGIDYKVAKIYELDKISEIETIIKGG